MEALFWFFLLISLGRIATSTVQLVWKTVSGAIASFSDSIGWNLKKLIVDIDPVQDLHGYDNPWPAGGGKNLIPFFENETKETVTLTNNNGEITLNGTATADAYFEVNVNIPVESGTTFYLCCFNPVETDSRVSLFAITTDGNPQKNMDTVNGKTSSTAATDLTITKIRIRAPVGVQLDNFKCSPMLQIGGTAPDTFSPYSNICPITGWTGANVTHTGKNLYHYDSDNATTAETTGGDTRGLYNLGLSGCTLTFSASLVNSGSATSSNINIGKMVNGKISVITSFISSSSITTRTYTFASNETAILVAASESVTAITGNLPKYNIQIEVGSTATDYEPYQGTTIPITFPSEAGTVYGGTLDVTNGVLTVDRVAFTIEPSTMSLSSGGNTCYSGAFRSEFGVTTNAGVVSGIKACNMTKRIPYADLINGGSGYAIENGGYLYFWWNGFAETIGSTIQQIREYFTTNPLIYIFEIPQPITYTLTPTEVKTLLGENNIWADTGNVEVEYLAKVTSDE